MSLFSIGKKILSENNDAKEMGFFDHLEELRWHLFRAALAILVVSIVVFIAKDFTFNTVIFGPKKPDFFTYRFFCMMSEATCIQPPDFDLITREMGEQFFVHLKVSFWMGLIVSFPYIFWEFWRFIKPGLYENERKAANGVVLACSILFISGVLFGYYVLTPFAITFLGGYSVGTEAVNAPTLSSYVNYLTMFTIPTGLLFELPLLAYFLGKLGLISSSFLTNNRKYAVIIILIIAAIVTPPDVVSQILISIPLFVLYEASIYIIKIQEKKRQTN